MTDSCYNTTKENAPAMLETSGSLVSINQRLRRIDTDMTKDSTPLFPLIIKPKKSRNRKHGMRQTPIYNIWSKMIGRCRNVNDAHHREHYIDRGITVCERWLKFENFLADMGDRPTGLTLERKDNNKGYSPENCIWADKRTQANNRRSNILITAGGETHTVIEWSRILDIPHLTIRARLKRGLTGEAALQTRKFSAANLTDEDCQKIREKYAAGNISQYELARQFNSSHSTIGRIIRGER